MKTPIMRNISNFCLLLAFSTALFYSCGSSKSFSDKHYNNRYYIGMTKKEKVKDSEVDSNNNFIKSEREEITSSERISSKVEKQTETILSSESNPSTDQTEVLKNHAEDEPGSIKSTKPKFSEQSVEKREPHFSMDKLPSFITKKIDHKTTISANSPPRGDALSLLWIIILILLILWLVGWLVGGFGIGGFIHLIALVAVVLLILWLLRII